MKRWIREVIRIVAGGLCLVFLWGGCQTPPSESDAPVWIIHNPYEGVDWRHDGRYKANLHTHTQVSDGALNPAEVVDRYRHLGYSILALTDHDRVTYPWTEFSKIPIRSGTDKRSAAGSVESERPALPDRDPQALGMVAVEGNELSKHHHLNSYFCGHQGTSTLETSLAGIQDKGGLAVLNHPGRKPLPIEDYAALYRQYPHLIGLEVFNQGDRYPGDRQTWDAILSRLMPARPVWGYSNDDLHTTAQLGRNWNIFLLPALTSAQVRRGMKEGHSYFVFSPWGPVGPPPPAVDEIEVNRKAGILRLQVSDCTQVVWIAQGREVQRGPVLELNRLSGPAGYVRAFLYGVSNTVAGTQPFGLTRVSGSEPRGRTPHL